MAQNANDSAGAKAWAKPVQDFRAAAAGIAGTINDGRDDMALGELLVSIAAEVQGQAGMARAGIMADFAARMNYARRHSLPGQLAGILQGLKQEKAAALAALSRRTAQEMKGRLAAVRGRRRQSPKGKPPGPAMP